MFLGLFIYWYPFYQPLLTTHFNIAISSVEMVICKWRTLGAWKIRTLRENILLRCVAPFLQFEFCWKIFEKNWIDFIQKTTQKFVLQFSWKDSKSGKDETNICGFLFSFSSCSIRLPWECWKLFFCFCSFYCFAQSKIVVIKIRSNWRRCGKKCEQQFVCITCIPYRNT